MPAMAFMAKLHKRMPVILDKGDIDARMAEPDEALMTSAPEDAHPAWRVDPRLGNNRYQREEAAEPFDAEKSGMSDS